MTCAKVRAGRAWLGSQFRKAGGPLARFGLMRTTATYRIGQHDDRVVMIDGWLAWFRRCFLRDRYVYFVSQVREPGGPVPLYIIERVTHHLAHFDSESTPVPAGYSGIHDDRRGFRKNPLAPTNRDQLFGERSALTVHGSWIDSTPAARHAGTGYALLSEIDGNPQNVAFGGLGEVPVDVRRFQTEQAAYLYLDNLTGEKVPGWLRHLAWATIGVSTIAWQWHSQIADLVAWLYSQIADLVTRLF